MLPGRCLNSRDICQVVVLDASTVDVRDIDARLLVPPFVLHGFCSSGISSHVLSIVYR
jgi:hypothetical protein